MNSGIDIATPDGDIHAYLVEPKALPAPAVVVIQEAIGVNSGLRATCDELATKGFIAICPDLYWRQEPMLQLSGEKDLSRAYALCRALDIDKGVAYIQETVERARDMYWCTGNVGVMGFGLGGLLTYLTAVRGGVDAGVCYYGDRTEEFLNESSSLRGPLLLHQGDVDEFVSPMAQAAIRRALAPRGVEIQTYAGSHHAFARPQGMHFDADAASEASARTVAFFRNHLRG
jgi:carboxymethylenebutenolidase